MQWRECYKMGERLRFVARLLEGEKMAVVCREFYVSRKTGYKIFTRYKDSCLEGLTDRSRRPYRHASRLRVEWVCRLSGTLSVHRRFLAIVVERF